MNVYMYAADLWCEDCGAKIIDELTAEGNAPEDPEDECSFDSDDFPKGPYPNGGGESDSPNHCAAGSDCINAVDGNGVFLENPLTDVGREYVKSAAYKYYFTKLPRAVNPPIPEWVKFYEIDVVGPEDECPNCHNGTLEYSEGNLVCRGECGYCFVW